MDSVRRASDALGISPKPQSHRKLKDAHTSSLDAQMLPTPSKTPCKQPTAQSEAASRSVARNLFGTSAVIADKPHKKAKKYTGLSLESFRAEEVEEDIEIFTDSCESVPVVDQSAENPFYGDHPVPEPSIRRSKRKQVVIPGEGKLTVEDAVKRSDGVLVVFRGKKIFRKFSEVNSLQRDDDDGDAEADEIETENADQPRRRGPMTRSSIKPRLLFPRMAKGKEAASTSQEHEDEEAVTDIEDHVLDGAEEAQTPEPETPVNVDEEQVKTPAAPRFAPASPPPTSRVTRSTDKVRDADTPMKKAKNSSPFDGWRRSKSRALTQGQKREGGALAQSPPSTKRPRA
ncbi:hypothetical protein F5Y17DRAFT_460349 [Xylariaceae sp. FL0594]|nr:hypothetical protein F5Y17DRAFT_460349 [Xylariaceae sp. FL0594]